MLHYEFLTADDSAGRTIRSWAALQLGEWEMNFGGAHDLIKRVQISELTVWVVNTVSVILLSNLAEMLHLCSVFLDMFQAGISEKSWRHWCL